jgi:hypothetical protein
MKIQINTDTNVERHEELVAQVEATVAKSMSHFSAQVTRVEIHLSDENGDETGQHNKRCMMKARLEGRRPTPVTCAAATMNQAIAGTADMLKSSIESTLGRLQSHH